MQVLRIAKVVEKVGYSRMHIYRLEKDGKFPKRIRLGPNSVGWLEHEIDDWIKVKVRERDAA